MKKLVLALGLVSLLALPACTAESRVAAIRAKAEQGDARAQGILGEMYANGTDVKRDYGQAVTWWKRSADNGLAAAAYDLGVLYERGQGVPRSDAQAAVWYRRAAAQGLAAAQYNLGVYQQQGRGGLPQDNGAAMAWYRKAAEQGHADAQYNLAALLAAEGRHADALFWLDVLAKNGDADAKSLQSKVAAHVSSAQADDIERRARVFRPVVVTAG